MVFDWDGYGWKSVFMKDVVLDAFNWGTSAPLSFGHFSR